MGRADNPPFESKLVAARRRRAREEAAVRGPELIPGGAGAGVQPLGSDEGGMSTHIVIR